MKLRNISAAIALAGLLSTPAFAAPISINGITIDEGFVFETFDVFEGEDFSQAGNGNGVIDQVGETLVGIGVVNRILDSNNNVVWQNGQGGLELTFHLYNYVAESINVEVFNPNLSIASILFTGGFVDFYTQALGTFSAVGTQAAGIASATAGDLWLSLAGSPSGGLGPVSSDPVTLTATNINTTGGDPLLASLNVTGNALFDAIGGPAGSFFDTNVFGCNIGAPAPCPDSADIKVTTSGQLRPIVAGGNQWGFAGTGEAQSFTEVPEPGVLALLGIGLLGLGAGAVRRKGL